MGREIGQKQIVALSSVTNFLGTAALAIGGWYGWSDFNRKAVALIISGVALQTLAPLAFGYFSIRTEALAARLQERARALDLFAELTHSLFNKKLAKNDDLRITLLEVDTSSNPPILRQRARCTNSGVKTPGTSTMTIQQGVAGKCFRGLGIAAANFEVEDFDDHMVDLGFTKQEAKQFERRGAYLCAPIVDSAGQVIAVLSMDAKNPNVFKPSHTEVAEWVTPFFAKYLTQPERGEHL